MTTVLDPTPPAAGLPTTLPPQAQLMKLLSGTFVTMGLHVAAKLHLADQLKDGPKNHLELAKLTDAQPDALLRLLRALASVGVLVENEDGRFDLTPVGECMVTDLPGSLHGLALMFGESFHRQVWNQLLYSVRTGLPAFDQVHGLGAFDYFERHPEAAEIFHNAMTSFSGSIADAVIDSYDFSRVVTVVDVAGGHGILLNTLLRTHPHLLGILFDLPKTLETVLLPSDLTGRLKLVTGDFFQSVPDGGDLYLLKSVIHDWDDAKAIDILRNVRLAMGKHGKLLLVESLLLPGNHPDLTKWIDLEMLVMTPGGRERTEMEYRVLLGKAGFELTQLIPTPSPLWLVEGMPV